MASSVGRFCDGLGHGDGAGCAHRDPVRDGSEPIMTKLVECVLPSGQEKWRPDPFPGSSDARMVGCCCPTQRLWPGRLVFAAECKVHELEPVAKQ